MAELKQYVVQEQENGSVLISEDVITIIVTSAIKDVEGVVSLSLKNASDFADIINRKNWGKGVKISTDDSGASVIECNINIAYGQNLIAVSKSVQQAVAAALESTAGITGTKINVNVVGIIRQ